MKFYFDLKSRETIAVKSLKEGRFFRIAGSEMAWQPLDAMTSVSLRVLRENPKMKKADRAFTYYWELPYGEAWEFKEWLKDHYKFQSCSFSINGVADGINIYCHSTRNEVGEPYLDCTVYLPHRIIDAVCREIMNEYLHQ